MKIYWFNSEMTELCELSKRRRNVLNNAAMLHKMIGLKTFGIVILGVIGITLYLVALQRTQSVLVRIFAYVLGTVVWLIAGMWQFFHMRSILRNRMRTRRGKPFVCFECGYPLRSIRGPACPECGAKIVL